MFLCFCLLDVRHSAIAVAGFFAVESYGRHTAPASEILSLAVGLRTYTIDAQLYPTGARRLLNWRG